MENKNNQCLNINEIDELNKLKILNSTLIKELRKYKEENAKLQKEKEILYGKIEKLEKENQTLKSDFSSMENQNPHEETMDIVENTLQSNIEIKEEPLDYYDLTKKYSNSESQDKTCSPVEKNDMEVTKFKCEICEKEISGKYMIKLHMENIHKGLKNYTYDKSFMEGGKLKKERDDIEMTTTQSLPPALLVEDQISLTKCNICEKVFKTKKVLHQHMKEIHEKKKYKCQNCGKEFGKSGHLTRHMKTHEDAETKLKTKLKCDSCDKTFTRKDNLKSHLVKMHQ